LWSDLWKWMTSSNTLSRRVIQMTALYLCFCACLMGQVAQTLVFEGCLVIFMTRPDRNSRLLLSQ
jgi:hypothetical protein